jgi:hypothetical protein
MISGFMRTLKINIMACSEPILNFQKELNLLSKFLILYNLIKLLEQSLHAQNAMRWCVHFLIFEVLCVMHREPAMGKAGGREQRNGGGFTVTASDWLVLGGSFYYWPTS